MSLTKHGDSSRIVAGRMILLVALLILANAPRVFGDDDDGGWVPPIIPGPGFDHLSGGPAIPPSYEVNRKNYLFLGSDNGGKAASVLYRRMASAKAN